MAEQRPGTPRDGDAGGDAERVRPTPPSELHQTAMDGGADASTARDVTGTQQAGFASDTKSAVDPDEDPVAVDSPATVDGD